VVYKAVIHFDAALASAKIDVRATYDNAFEGAGREMTK
jgi:hypothetical protein